MNKMDPKNSNKPEDILNGGNSSYLEYLQNMYIKDPKSVDQSWSSFFESNDFCFFELFLRRKSDRK